MKKQKLKIASYQDRLLQKVIESNEEMINISETLKNIKCIHENPDMQKYTGQNIWVRKSVASKLEEASGKLSKLFPNFQFKVVFGFRHPEVQKFYFERRKKMLRQNDASLSEEELEELADTMSANPKVAGHPTGGAVDITITTQDTDLDMGTRISDFTDTEKIKTFSNSISEIQKENRKLLHDIMTSVGFAPYYGEWWHFSYGDKEWAFFYNQSCAIYDQINFTT